MESESKYSGENELFYETEYLLHKDIHYRKGEILKLEHINAKHCREIERLNEKISTILEPISYVSHENLFEYLKALLLHFSREEGNAEISPGVIDVKYIEAACRYCFPVLFDKYAILDQDDENKIKIELAEHILEQFGLTKMYEFENLLADGEIDIPCIDHRSQKKSEDPCLLINEDDEHKTELADSILHKFGIETMAKYEELIMRGDIDIAFIDRRQMVEMSNEELGVLGGLMGGDTGLRYPDNTGVRT